MNTEQEAFRTLEQQTLSHLQVVAQRLEQEAMNGGLARGLRTYRRRVKNVLGHKTAEREQWERRDIQRHLDDQISQQARYDQGYDQGKQALNYRGHSIEDRCERRGYDDGFSGHQRKRIRE